MILAIISDNWGIAIGIFLIILAFQTPAVWTKVILILLGLFFITFNIWKGWFSFRSQPTEEDSSKDSTDEEAPKSK